VDKSDSSKESAQDNLTAEQTVQFLGSELKMAQHRLHKLIKVKKNVQMEANKTRGLISNIQNRIQLELDKNPAIFREFRKNMEEEQSGE
jgi:hypothetical protein